ncbi:hypothetical protein GCK32_010945 [Trichostrongylus colubriformis]|uniref:Uncharacterized protein n=1 Tax=Trichostrongylus colubriformis TaxID=6319 RepID=A0AAN8IN34_TRICO
MRLEAEAEDLQNKKYELEGEVHLIKHQLSTKTEELAAAKENFCHMQVAAQAVSTELTSNHKGVTTELQKATEKKHSRNPGKRREKLPENCSLTNSKAPSTKRRVPKHKFKADKNAEKVDAKRAEEHGNQRSPDIRAGQSSDAMNRKNFLKKMSIHEISKDQGAGEATESRSNVHGETPLNRKFEKSQEMDTRNNDSDGVKSSSLQHTNTLASTLAEDFSNAFLNVSK